MTPLALPASLGGHQSHIAAALTSSQQHLEQQMQLNAVLQVDISSIGKQQPCVFTPICRQCICMLHLIPAGYYSWLCPQAMMGKSIAQNLGELHLYRHHDMHDVKAFCYAVMDSQHAANINWFDMLCATPQSPSGRAWCGKWQKVCTESWQRTVMSKRM